MDNLTNFFTKEKDFLYQLGQMEGIERGIEKGIEQGLEQGQEKKTIEFIKSLLCNTNHTIPEIASLVNVSEAFVREVRKSVQP